MKVLVCGGRDYVNRDNAFRWFDKLFAPDYPNDIEGRAGTWLPRPDLEIITGGAKGADELAEAWAVINWVKFRVYPADWEKHGRAAGIIRNQEMLDKEKPDMVLSFPGGRGTQHMKAIATLANVPVMEIYT